MAQQYLERTKRLYNEGDYRISADLAYNALELALRAAIRKIGKQLPRKHGGVLFDGLSEKSIVFYLNKQVAYVGHLSFSKPVAESPLGPIKVQIRCDDPRKLIEWLAPKTA